MESEPRYVIVAKAYLANLWMETNVLIPILIKMY